jgi:NitT/TauT family transport system ATP-binding protein
MLEIANVRKYFTTPKGRFAALDDVSFKVREGEFVSVVGPSGCGKSTLLNIVAGLTRPDEGQVLLNGEIVRDVTRRMGYTFQQSTLLPWRTVRDNVGLGLELRGVPPAGRTPIVERLLEQMGLTQFADAHPHQLSGGMAKRAEIARVLAIDPEILLMDEPFGALDAQTKIAMQNHLLHLLQTMRKTVLFITHDLEEALILSDRVITMRARPGRIRGEHVIPLERPRDARQARVDHRFPDVLRAIWDDIEPSGAAAGGHP